MALHYLQDTSFWDDKKFNKSFEFEPDYPVEKAKKPYGHKEYQRTSPTGKIVSIPAKGVKPEEEFTENAEIEATIGAAFNEDRGADIDDIIQRVQSQLGERGIAVDDADIRSYVQDARESLDMEKGIGIPWEYQHRQPGKGSGKLGDKFVASDSKLIDGFKQLHKEVLDAFKKEKDTTEAVNRMGLIYSELNKRGYNVDVEGNKLKIHKSIVGKSFSDLIEKAKKKPYGHTAYTRMTPKGKIAQVGAKGIKPTMPQKPESEVGKTEDVGTWLPIFPGFYGTAFEADDDLLTENLKEDGLLPEELEEVWDLDCYDKAEEVYKQEVVNASVDSVAEALHDYVSSITMEKVVSPREYNYRNDAIDVKITLTPENKEAIKKFIAEHADEWAKHIEDHYTSSDGFISSYSNDASSDEWDIDKALADDHKLGQVLSFILEKGDLLTEEGLVEDIRGNIGGLYIPVDTVRDELTQKDFYEDKPELVEKIKNEAKEKELEETNEKLPFKQTEDFEKAKKPYGHKQYQRLTPKGKLVQVPAKGVKPTTINKEVMSHLLKEAQKNKAWAIKISKDKEWMENASEMSKQMVKERMEKPIEELARNSYDYLKMRAAAFQNNYPIAKDAMTKWLQLGGKAQELGEQANKFITQNLGTSQLPDTDAPNMEKKVEPILQKGEYAVYRRTFEATKFPKGSPERTELNKDGRTSEYFPSHKFAINGPNLGTSVKNLADAKSTLEIYSKPSYEQVVKESGDPEKLADRAISELKKERKPKPIDKVALKFESLVNDYKSEVKESGYSEDMGRKYEREFESYVGDKYEYPYNDRLKIDSLSQRLSDITSSPVNDFNKSHVIAQQQARANQLEKSLRQERLNKSKKQVKHTRMSPKGTPFQAGHEPRKISLDEAASKGFFKIPTANTFIRNKLPKQREPKGNVALGYQALMNEGMTREEVSALTPEEFGKRSVQAMLKQEKQRNQPAFSPYYDATPDVEKSKGKYGVGKKKMPIAVKRGGKVITQTRTVGTKPTVNYQKHWDSNGTTYDQTVNISEEQLNTVKSLIDAEVAKLNKEFGVEGVMSGEKAMKLLYLKQPLEQRGRGVWGRGGVVFTNHTQRDFIANALGFKLKDRNTAFLIRNTAKLPKQQKGGTKMKKFLGRLFGENKK